MEPATSGGGGDAVLFARTVLPSSQVKVAARFNAVDGARSLRAALAQSPPCNARTRAELAPSPSCNARTRAALINPGERWGAEQVVGSAMRSS